MALRDKLAASAAPHLHSGEVVQSTFIAQRGNPNWFILSYWIIIAKGYYVVVATNERIVVFRAGALKVTTFNSLALELPRATRFGAPKGVFRYKFRLGDENVWVHRKFWKDLRTADAAG